MRSYLFSDMYLMLPMQQSWKYVGAALVFFILLVVLRRHLGLGRHVYFAPNVQQIWEESKEEGSTVEPTLSELMESAENPDLRELLQSLSTDLQTVTVAKEGPYVWIDTPRDPPRLIPSAKAWQNKYFPQPELQKYVGKYVPPLDFNQTRFTSGTPLSLQQIDNLKRLQHPSNEPEPAGKRRKMQ